MLRLHFLAFCAVAVLAKKSSSVDDPNLLNPEQEEVDDIHNPEYNLGKGTIQVIVSI